MLQWLLSFVVLIVFLVAFLHKIGTLFIIFFFYLCGSEGVIEFVCALT